jgi:tetratricopeptide (TPR) repeat protein
MSATPETDSRPAAPELFISYSSADLARAEALFARLHAEGFQVWFDKARLRPGHDWHKEIEAGCEAARVVVALITPRWKGSEWTRFETYGHGNIVMLLAEGEPKDVLTPPLAGKQGLAFDPLTADAAAWRTLIAALRARLAEKVPERAARLVDLPYPANPFFTGRDNDLLRIHEELHTAPVTALVQSRVRALAAMGGVGKTTLANEYARRYWRLYPQIFWLDARRGYENEFALLFDKLFPEHAGFDIKPAEKARLALAELNGKPERLLVIDNVEDEVSVRPWLPRNPTSNCRTLITSRFADWPEQAGIRAVTLYVLEPEPARDFLLARTGRRAEGAELAACDDLARELGYLPLALEQAGAYIAAPGAGIGFAGYLALYREAHAELLGRGALGSTEYPDPVITTWRATMDRLSPESRAVLRLCAWLADTPIPRQVVMEGAEDVLALAEAFGPVAPLADSKAAAEMRMRDALTGLARYSMVLDGSGDTFRVHGLVQTVERLRAVAEDAAEGARRHALARLVAVFPYAQNEPQLWPLCRLLLPHQRRMTALLGERDEAATHSALLNRTGGFLEGSGNAAAALPLFRRALEANERVLGAEHPDTLTSVNNLALCLRTLGDAPAALPLFRRALEARERVLGAEHPITLDSVSNLAVCLQTLGDAPAALPLYRRALEARERVRGPEHPDTLDSVNNLAVCLHALGDAPAALPLFRRALEARERMLGAEHPDTFASVNNLAACLEMLGDAPAALPFYRRALDGSERVLGPEHPETLTSVNNLALCLQALGDIPTALPLYRRALEACERVLGAEHPDTLTSVNNLAFCLQALGDAPAALPLHRRALEANERVRGAEHPYTLLSVHNLGCCLFRLGEFGEALALLRRAAETAERRLGPDHPTTRRFRTTLEFAVRARDPR